MNWRLEVIISKSKRLQSPLENPVTVDYVSSGYRSANSLDPKVGFRRQRTCSTCIKNAVFWQSRLKNITELRNAE